MYSLTGMIHLYSLDTKSQRRKATRGCPSLYLFNPLIVPLTYTSVRLPSTQCVTSSRPPTHSPIHKPIQSSLLSQTHPHTYPSIISSFFSSTNLCVNPSTHPPIYLSFLLSTHLSILPSSLPSPVNPGTITYPSTYLFNHFFIFPFNFF